ncbi:hypothetical protein Ciccas_001498 [Cichlidogyrus casuarinus]|uniref:Uncharacterized protein n=1 Tax=Cichlidogyrus casuarinus TaxID=1844966 RepID=A0ABD2QJW1_9PLAT
MISDLVIEKRLIDFHSDAYTKDNAAGDTDSRRGPPTFGCGVPLRPRFIPEDSAEKYYQGSVLEPVAGRSARFVNDNGKGTRDEPRYPSKNVKQLCLQVAQEQTVWFEGKEDSIWKIENLSSFLFEGGKKLTVALGNSKLFIFTVGFQEKFDWVGDDGINLDTQAWHSIYVNLYSTNGGAMRSGVLIQFDHAKFFITSYNGGREITNPQKVVIGGPSEGGTESYRFEDSNFVSTVPLLGCVDGFELYDHQFKRPRNMEKCPSCFTISHGDLHTSYPLTQAIWRGNNYMELMIPEKFKNNNNMDFFFEYSLASTAEKPYSLFVLEFQAEDRRINFWLLVKRQQFYVETHSTDDKTFIEDKSITVDDTPGSWIAVKLRIIFNKDYVTYIPSASGKESEFEVEVASQPKLTGIYFATSESGTFYSPLNHL